MHVASSVRPDGALTFLQLDRSHLKGQRCSRGERSHNHPGERLGPGSHPLPRGWAVAACLSDQPDLASKHHRRTCLQEQDLTQLQSSSSKARIWDADPGRRPFPRNLMEEGDKDAPSATSPRPRLHRLHARCLNSGIMKNRQNQPFARLPGRERCTPGRGQFRQRPAKGSVSGTASHPPWGHRPSRRWMFCTGDESSRVSPRAGTWRGFSPTPPARTTPVEAKAVLHEGSVWERKLFSAVLGTA